MDDHFDAYGDVLGVRTAISQTKYLIALLEITSYQSVPNANDGSLEGFRGRTIFAGIFDNTGEFNTHDRPRLRWDGVSS